MNSRDQREALLPTIPSLSSFCMAAPHSQIPCCLSVPCNLGGKHSDLQETKIIAVRKGSGNMQLNQSTAGSTEISASIS